MLDRLRKLREKAAMGFVWMLPRWIVELCAIRIWANATTGRYSDKEAPGVTVDEAVARWRRGDGGDGTFPTSEVYY